MTSQINQILEAIATTGATESSDPLRAYIADLEQQNQTLSYQLQMGVDDATNPLKEQIKTLTQQLADAQAGFAAQLASDIGSATAEAVATVAARDAEIARLNTLLDAVRALLAPPAAPAAS